MTVSYDDDGGDFRWFSMMVSCAFPWRFPMTASADVEYFLWLWWFPMTSYDDDDEFL